MTGLTRQSPLPLLLAGALLWWACSPDKEKTPDEISPADTPADAPAFPGEVAGNQTFRTRKIIHQDIQMKTSAGTTRQQKVFGYGTAYQVLSKNSARRVIRREPYWFMVRQSENHGDSKGSYYDSGKSKITDLPPALWTQAREIGKSLEIVLDSDGNIQKTRGTKKLRQAMKQEARNLFGENYEQNNFAAYQLKSFYKDANIRRRLRGEFSATLPKTIQPGDSWRGPDETQMGNFLTKTHYTFLEKRGGLAKLKLNQTIRRATEKAKTDYGLKDYSPAAQKYLQDNTKYKTVQGKASGIIWVRPESGLVISGKIQQSLEYKMTVSGRDYHYIYNSDITYEPGE